MAETKDIKSLSTYLRSLSVAEPFEGGSPQWSKVKEQNPNQSFTESLSAYNKTIERCSDDFSHFNFTHGMMQSVMPPICIAYSERYGRFLQASRDIEAGETIFWEMPLVLAPKGASDPVCLDCYKPLPKSDWPVCSGCNCPKCDKCQGGEHSSLECDILRDTFNGENIASNLRLVQKLNVILTPLRTQLVILDCPSKENIIMALQSNVLQRRQSSIGEYLEKHIVPLFTNVSKLNIASDFVQVVCGVFDTNAFDVTIADQRHARALLPLAAIMNHSCIPNTQHWFIGGYCVVRASVPIKKGDGITNTYTQTLWGTRTRQSHLTLTKLFTCKCPRCQDPSELGTHFSSIKCQKCKDKGVLVPPSVGSQQWTCNLCGDQSTSSSALNIVKVASSFVSRAESMDDEDLTKVLLKLNLMLGMQHFTSVQLHILFIKKIVESIETVNEEFLVEVLSSIKLLMPIIDKIEPGLTKLRGIFLLNKIKTVAELVSRVSTQRLPAEVVRKVVQEDETLLDLENEAEECEVILKWDALSEDIRKLRQQWKISTKDELQKLLL